MVDDFQAYDQVSNSNIHTKFTKVYSGEKHDLSLPGLVTTWQSILKDGTNLTVDYDVIIGDEAHDYQAKTMTQIMTDNGTSRVRIGTTGTLRESKGARMHLESLFGPVSVVTTLKELEEKERVSKLDIQVIELKHPHSNVVSFVKQIDPKRSRPTYFEEVDYIVKNSKRTRFIARLAFTIDTSGTVLILFQKIEHGKAIFDQVQRYKKEHGHDDVAIYYVDGSVDMEYRQSVKKDLQKNNKSIFVASFGIMRQGVSIPEISDIIFASSTKSRIRTLQSIGRGLRLKEGKDGCTLWDVADILIPDHYKTPNKLMEHALERQSLYEQEQFNVTKQTIRI
jgi:superfamily II DNA or RNA helicase